MRCAELLPVGECFIFLLKNKKIYLNSLDSSLLFIISNKAFIKKENT